ncbi:hypothetical protein JIG36_08740 [Actinoplanes sp. LDG1-06]|uniref:Integral membrane protein n=1 Tax=Paractinoplanes ovalisporus TaxID=2810368 RepID=A0ABS2A720_9ACTN|nr:DUF6223 family protein [Actinoplanes ovalisporus]MBM2615637.1 hypothetical protein [Actinoplanes ovalisporus]
MFTVDRAVATLAALLALAGVISAFRAHRAVALVAGATGTLIGAFVVLTADGGPGTGNGVVGGWAALVLGPSAIALAYRRGRRARSRRFFGTSSTS